MFKNLKAELDSIMGRDPVTGTRLEIFLLYSGSRTVRSYRRANWFYRHDVKLIARYISQRACYKTGIEIHPVARIGKGLPISHGTGAMIDETAKIGDYCTLHQGVALGGTGRDQGRRCPILGNNVMVNFDAKILGPLKVGGSTRVAAGAAVLNEVPPGVTVVGVPTRIVRIDGEKSYELDRINVSDSVKQGMADLQNVCTALGIQVEALMDRLESYQKDRAGKEEP